MEADMSDPSAMSTIDIIQSVGVFFGVVAFLWKVADVFRSYIHIGLILENGGASKLLAKVTVENKGVTSKKIENALLLIGPNAESPITTFNTTRSVLGPYSAVNSTNEISVQKFSADIYDGNGRAVIPLPFFYSENIGIADENPACTAPIDLSYFPKPGVYAVRLFVTGQGRLHRTTHDAFVR
jgi:hypothetical protein